MRLASAQVLAAVALLCGCTCCSGSSTTGTTTGSTSGGNGTTTGGTGGYTTILIDADAGSIADFTVTVGPSDKIGVAWYQPQLSSYLGQNDLLVMYTELQNGAITVPMEKIRTVQNPGGLTVAFQPTGEPAVGFFGGDAGELLNAKDPDSGMPVMSTYWAQSQAEIDYRQGTNSWTQEICMDNSTEDGTFIWGGLDMLSSELDNNPLGFVVGKFPSLLFDGGTALMVFRDNHEGQFPVQDYGASNAKMCIGGPGPGTWSWSAPMTISGTGNHKEVGYGTHNQMIFGAGGLLAVIGDTDVNDEGAPQGAGTGPINFATQTGMNTGTTADWNFPVDPFNPSNMVTAEINATAFGLPQVAYENPNSGGAGYMAVVTDTAAGTPVLWYASSLDGQTWGERVAVYQNGSGGFFPQIQVDPTTGIPTVSYFICSLTGGAAPNNAGACTSDAELDTTNGQNNDWSGNSNTEAKGFFYDPQLRFLSTGKKVFVFSNSKGLQIMIQN